MLIDEYETGRRKARYRVLLISLGAILLVGLPAVFLAYLAHYYQFVPATNFAVYSDVQRFDDALDEFFSDDDFPRDGFDGNYLSEGSRGLRSLIAAYRLDSHGLALMVSQERDSWAGCRLANHLKTGEPRLCISPEFGCSSVTYREYTPSTRLVSRAPRRSRCNAGFHHRLLVCSNWPPRET